MPYVIREDRFIWQAMEEEGDIDLSDYREQAAKDGAVVALLAFRGLGTRPKWVGFGFLLAIGLSNAQKGPSHAHRAMLRRQVAAMPLFGLRLCLRTT